MMMKKALVATTAVALAAGTLTLPNRAHALAEWVIPTIVATGLGGVVVGSAATQGAYNNGYGYAPTERNIYVRPTGARYCHPGREQGPDGSWHRVQVCE